MRQHCAEAATPVGYLCMVVQQEVPVAGGGDEAVLVCAPRKAVADDRQAGENTRHHQENANAQPYLPLFINAYR